MTINLKTWTDLRRPLLIAAGVTLLGQWGWVWLAALVGGGFYANRGLADQTLGTSALRSSSQYWLSTAAWPVIVRLTVANSPAVTSGALSFAVLTLVLAVWLAWLDRRPSGLRAGLAVAGVNQFLLLEAVFLATAFWKIPDFILIGLAAAGSFLVADQLLMETGDRARTALAMAWALVVAECTWIFTTWLVSYVIGWLAPAYLIIPQPAVVLTALGYCYGGIYLAHREGKLSRGRLAEYLLIGLALLITVIAGTEWNKIV